MFAKPTWGRFLPALCLAALVTSCSEPLSEQAAKHEVRGDGYVQHEQFREAMIEFKNAVRAAPDNPSLQWKLAKAALKGGDPSTAYQALGRVVQLDPSHFEAKWSLGDLYLAGGKMDEVGKIAEELVSGNPQHPAGYLLRAAVALGAERNADAIAILKQTVKLDPKMVGPHLALANIHFAQHDIAQAAEWYERGVKADPASVGARIARGQFLIATGAPEEGRREFHKAVELSSDQESIKLVLAERYATLGLREDAEHELSALIADRHSQRARKALAELKLTLGEVAPAKPLLQAILAADEHDPVGLYLKGRVAFAERDLLQAASLFEAAIGRDTTLVGPHVYLGLIRSTQGRMDQAEESLREAIRRDPSNQTAHLALARLYLTQEKPKEAEKEVSQTLRVNPASLEAAVLYGDVFVFGKNWARAEEVYGAISRQLPGQPIGYVKMAALRQLQARPAEAAELFAQALVYAPDDPVIMQDYLVTLVESKQSQQADRVLGAYLAKTSRDPNTWRLAGRVYVAQGKIDQAQKAFRKAVDLAPDLALAHYELGQVQLLQNKLPAAVSAFQTALKKDETNSAIHTALGMVLARRGQVDAANGHYKRAFQLNPRDVVAANNLAANLSDQQELDDALGFARDALELAPSNPAIKDTLGWIYYKQGRFDRAYAYLAEASAALPQHPVVRYHHAVALSKIGRQTEALSELKSALSLPGGFPEAEQAARMVAANKMDE